ncbi:hypothetical protein ACMD2_00348 [Ananas comosus]|uniref:Uncharacterized protein n=1 Tax=Ananas comosus TaxID=4615 RepID=A0A199URS0_ANACO|nr:hypothetical protein ACMD2_00348 [Ananas comosus]
MQLGASFPMREPVPRVVAVCPHYLRFTAHLSISQRKIGSGSGGRRRRRRRRRRGSRGRSISMNWISRKIHLYNVTMGLYMLDWWERYLFSILFDRPPIALDLFRPSDRCREDILILVLLWFIFYNGSRSASEFYNSYLKPKLLVDGKFVV